MWNLTNLGYYPLKLLLGTAVYSLGIIGGLKALFKSFSRGEIHDLTSLIYDAREHAIGLISDEAKAIGADDVVGIKTHIHEFGGLIEFMAIGTAIKRQANLTTVSPQLPPQAIIRDKDTWISDDSLFGRVRRTRGERGRMRPLRRRIRRTRNANEKARIMQRVTDSRIAAGLPIFVLLWLGLSQAIWAQTADKNRTGDVRPGPTITNSVGMKLILIPAGEFVMGPAADEKGRDAKELQHRVRITKPFYLGAYEVTQAEYQAVTGKNPSEFAASGSKNAEVAGIRTEQFPVEYVSWDDANAFCRQLSEKEGKRYRLPTEAEWEYACRAGTKTPFSFGNACNGREANCYGRQPYGTATEGPVLERTAAVGSYQPNRFGLYDMAGNVREWCTDWYADDYYGHTPLDDPNGPESGSVRVLRGGGYLNDAGSCRSAARGFEVPARRTP